MTIDAQAATPPPPAPRRPTPTETVDAAPHATGAALGRVVPAPTVVRPTADAAFPLTPDTAIRTSPDPAAQAVGDYLAGLLRPPTGFPLPVSAAPEPGAISLLLTEGGPEIAGQGDEGYHLEIDADGVMLRARTGAGLFHGVQTLRQLLPPDVESRTPRPGPWLLPGGQIVDHPRFGYRGAMLDVARHFFAVPDVLRFVDHLARYKINHLHLHLTDDQGWRIAVDSWPRLAEVGGATEVDGGPGGYYTKAQYREIVEYAASRYITIVPEIDLPGHTNAALTAYGELAPDGVAPAPYTGTDVGFSAVAVHSGRTYDFVDDVLGELAALTPGRYLHIGGDEAFTVPPADYATFVDRVQPIVAAKGKTVLGWHQLAVAAHVEGRVLQYWGTATVDPLLTEAVRHGAKLLLSPGNRAYLDMKYTPATPLGKDWAGLVDVRTAYDWDPGTYLDGVPESAVIGVEAPLWTETISNLTDVELMTFPRLPALAELGWSPARARDWADFRGRLAAQAPRWTRAGITFHRSPEVPWPGPDDADDTPHTGAVLTAEVPAAPEAALRSPEVSRPPDDASLDPA